MTDNGSLSTGYIVRQGVEADVGALPDIERRAAARFADIGLDMLVDGPVTGEPVFRAACHSSHLWVAVLQDGSAVGFAMARALGGGLHLQEMDVVPEHGRRGLGKRLVEAVVGAALLEGAARVTLTTFRDIPWNGPFYSRMGFVEWPATSLPSELRALVVGEIDAGLIPDLRMVMKHELIAS